MVSWDSYSPISATLSISIPEDFSRSHGAILEDFYFYLQLGLSIVDLGTGHHPSYHSNGRAPLCLRISPWISTYGLDFSLPWVCLVTFGPYLILVLDNLARTAVCVLDIPFVHWIQRLYDCVRYGPLCFG